jgi:hypothetical protein
MDTPDFRATCTLQQQQLLLHQLLLLPLQACKR